MRVRHLICSALLILVQCKPGITRDPRQILERHYETKGWTDSTRPLTSFYKEVDVTSRGTGIRWRNKHWEKGVVLSRTEHIFDQFIMLFGADGNRAWSVDQFGRVSFVESEEELTAHQHDMMVSRGDLRSDSSSFSIMYLGLETINDATCHVIKAINDSTRTAIIFYIDSLTYFSLKEINEYPAGRVVQEFSDFRRVDGFLWPFQCRYTETQNGETISIEQVITRVVVNPTLADSIFEPSADTLADMEFD